MILNSLTYFMLSMPGGSEWILIVIVVLLLFGGKKIPELMKGIGRGMREFNDAKDNVKSGIEEGMREKDVVKTTTTETTTSASVPVVPAASVPVAPPPARETIIPE